MIVLKTLSREFNIEPFLLRRILRKEFGKVIEKRWRWEDNDPKLKKIRTFLRSYSSDTTKHTGAPKKTSGNR